MPSQSKPGWIEASTTVGDENVADAAATAFDAGDQAHVVVEERRAGHWIAGRVDSASKRSWLITGYWLADDAASARRARLEAIVGAVTCRPVDDVDWATAWREHHSVIPIGTHLEIAPPWTTDPPADGRTRIVVEPGAAFGTGAHASTRTCLELLERIGPGDGPVLDVGCGSGILAVVALRLGAPSVIACDIASDAPPATLHTARLNHVADRITAVHGTVDAIHGRFTRIFVNIGGPEAITHASKIAARLTRDGVAIVGGILSAEWPAVESALVDAGLHITAANESADFTAIATA